jgi:hypothetical protein
MYQKTSTKKKYADHGKINFYLSAALNISGTSSNAAEAYTMGGGPSYTSYLPAFSVGVNVIPNPNTGEVEFRAELSFSETQFNALYKLTVSPYVPEKAHFNQLSIYFLPQIIYNFYNANNLKIYGGVGAGLVHFSFSNASFGPQNPNNSDDGIGANDPYFFNGTDGALLLTAGAKFNNKFGFFFKYFTNTATTKGGYFGFVDSSQQIGFVYFLGK